jgi:hypothetical protein
MKLNVVRMDLVQQEVNEVDSVCVETCSDSYMSIKFPTYVVLIMIT